MKQPLCGEDPTLGRRLARRQSRAAGISLPWERNESAMARVFPGASTFAHHGGLTPPALGCVCGCHCRYGLRANEYAAFPTGGSRPPLLVALAVVTADMRFSPASMPVFPMAGLCQPLLVDGDAMIRRIGVCNGQCVCIRVAMERSELADILLLFARMHVHKSGDGVVVVPVSLALRLANFKNTCTRVWQLHCNYRRKQGRGLRISIPRA